MKVMDVPDKARLIADRVSGNADAADIVKGFLERRRMVYNPPEEVRPDVTVPERYYPQPDYGDYEYPESTGMIQAMPIQRDMQISVPPTGVLADEVTVPVSDLFSDEAIARRALKQRYAESGFNDKAVSKAGAQGAWQIMPITLKDYLGRGRGKAGDLNDPEYNRKVRDWVMGIIPRDLQEFWSEEDSDRAKLAKLYAAYNWGAGNLRSFLRKKQKAGVDISNPDNWVDDLNPETRRYVKYLAFDEDIPDSIYTNSAFEESARKNGYMAEGGRLFEMGGPSGPINPNILRQTVKQTLLRIIPQKVLVGAADLADNIAGIPSLSQIKEIPERGDFYVNALDNGESKYYEDGYIENPGLTFLLDRGRQSEMLQKMGYHPVNDGYYGSVTSATRKLNALKGDVIPIFQRGDDEVDFSEVEPVADKDGNYFFERTSYLGDIFGENELNHASYHPVSFYRHKGTGDIYVRGYDLNDYGKHDKNIWRNLPEAIGNSLFNQGYSYDKTGQTYGDEQYLAEIYDYIGNPFVQRTALVKAPEELVKKYFGDNYASGGKIRIKPENRGKFTALLKRTGKSASWFKEHGTPAQKKMAVFALNAKKWKHEDGGLLHQYDEGGFSYRPESMLYSFPEQQQVAPVPYSVDGYKEQQFYDDPANKINYLVQPGDTAWEIATSNSMPVRTLLRYNPEIGNGNLIRPGQRLSLGYKEYVPDIPNQKVETDDNMYYSVQSGDYLGKIAKDNGMSLQNLLKLNPQFKGREDSIAIGEKVNLGKPKQEEQHFDTLRERREWESGLDNLGAIQNYKHQKNYAVVDKDAQTMTIYSPDNKILKRVHVNTGKSNNDYNTRTYEDEKGHILSGQGNMSTPAGITEIVGVGRAYGHTNFVRARIGNDGRVRKVYDDKGNLVDDTIASSMHYEGRTLGPNESNGCIRLNGKDADSLKGFLDVGSRVYTLPQMRDENGNLTSRFSLEDGKLSFYSDDPVGETDNDALAPVPVYQDGKIKRNNKGEIVYRDFASEDDFNQTVDMTAGPLHSVYEIGDEPMSEYERNRAIFSTTLAGGKQSLMKELIDNGIGINSDTYNRLAELAMAIANQESQFGTSTMFLAKSSFPNVVKKAKNENEALSTGITQMKYEGYNDEVKKIMKKMGIDTSSDTKSQWNVENSARATMALLAYFYKEQLTPYHRKKLKENGMSEEEALAMMFNGKSVKYLEELTKDPDWRSRMKTVPILPGGYLKNLLNKEVLVTDYANKAMNYMHENESFHLKNGGLIEKINAMYAGNPSAICSVIASVRARQKK